MTQSLQAEIPDQLLRQTTVLVREGWAADRDEMLTEACAGIWILANAELIAAWIRGRPERGLGGMDEQS